MCPPWRTWLPATPQVIKSRLTHPLHGHGLHELLSPGNATPAAADRPSSKHALVHDAKLQDVRVRGRAPDKHAVHTSAAAK